MTLLSCLPWAARIWPLLVQECDQEGIDLVAGEIIDVGEHVVRRCLQIGGGPWPF